MLAHLRTELSSTTVAARIDAAWELHDVVATGASTAASLQECESLALRALTAEHDDLVLSALLQVMLAAAVRRHGPSDGTLAFVRNSVRVARGCPSLPVLRVISEVVAKSVHETLAKDTHHSIAAELVPLLGVLLHRVLSGPALEDEPLLAWAEHVDACIASRVTLGAAAVAVAHWHKTNGTSTAAELSGAGVSDLCRLARLCLRSCDAELCGAAMECVAAFAEVELDVRKIELGALNTKFEDYSSAIVMLTSGVTTASRLAAIRVISSFALACGQHSVELALLDPSGTPVRVRVTLRSHAAAHIAAAAGDTASAVRVAVATALGSIGALGSKKAIAQLFTKEWLVASASLSVTGKSDYKPFVYDSRWVAECAPLSSVPLHPVVAPQSDVDTVVLARTETSCWASSLGALSRLLEDELAAVRCAAVSAAGVIAAAACARGGVLREAAAVALDNAIDSIADDAAAVRLASLEAVAHALSGCAPPYSLPLVLRPSYVDALVGLLIDSDAAVRREAFAFFHDVNCRLDGTEALRAFVRSCGHIARRGAPPAVPGQHTSAAGHIVPSEALVAVAVAVGARHGGACAALGKDERLVPLEVTREKPIPWAVSAVVVGGGVLANPHMAAHLPRHALPALRTLLVAITLPSRCSPTIPKTDVAISGGHCGDNQQRNEGVVALCRLLSRGTHAVSLVPSLDTRAALSVFGDDDEFDVTEAVIAGTLAKCVTLAKSADAAVASESSLRGIVTTLHALLAGNAGAAERDRGCNAQCCLLSAGDHYNTAVEQARIRGSRGCLDPLAWLLACVRLTDDASRARKMVLFALGGGNDDNDKECDLVADVAVLGVHPASNALRRCLSAWADSIGILHTFARVDPCFVAVEQISKCMLVCATMCYSTLQSSHGAAGGDRGLEAATGAPATRLQEAFITLLGTGAATSGSADAVAMVQRLSLPRCCWSSEAAVIASARHLRLDLWLDTTGLPLAPDAYVAFAARDEHPSFACHVTVSAGRCGTTGDVRSATQLVKGCLANLRVQVEAPVSIAINARWSWQAVGCCACACGARRGRVNISLLNFPSSASATPVRVVPVLAAGGRCEQASLRGCAGRASCEGTEALLGTARGVLNGNGGVAVRVGPPLTVWVRKE